jgi:uncharacterized protein YndB with AHSA1/START domain
MSNSYIARKELAVSGAIATARTDLTASHEVVWAALTRPAEISAWMPGSHVETTWEVGSPITWTGEYDGRAYQDKGEVLAVDKPRVLSMTHYSPLMGDDDVPENYHTLVYTLTPTDSGAHLELTQDGCENAEQAEQFSQNWQAMLDSLRTHVEGLNG